jgi:hypothetical protein
MQKREEEEEHCDPQKIGKITEKDSQSEIWKSQPINSLQLQPKVQLPLRGEEDEASTFKISQTAASTIRQI